MYSRLDEVVKEQIRNLEVIRTNGYIESVSEVIDMQIAALKRGNKVLIAGNGGSAADAQHFAGEFVGRFLKERKGMPAIALTTDTSVLTCIGNDYGYDKIFARQIEALGKSGDVFIGISTSGNSQNVIEAVEKAKEMGIQTVGLLGKDGGKLKEICDQVMLVPLKETPRVQEIHTMTVHMMCEMVESKMIEEEN